MGKAGHLYRIFHHGLGGNNLRKIHVLNKLFHIVIGRIRQDIFRGAFLDDLSVLHKNDPVTQFEGLIEIVTDEDYRLLYPFLEIQKFILHVSPDERVEGAEGLVHQHDIRVERQRPCQTHPLLHPSAELPRIGVLPPLEADLLQDLHCLFPANGGGHLLNLEPVFHVPDHASAGKERKVLKYHAEALLPQLAEFFPGQGGNIDTIQIDLPV
ncbi:MAG: hypothetical protein C5S52_00190 [ANME-2 cluster archaeon]|nr:hypothetical protein [ANME-2 cluster archaeon]